MLNVIHTPIHLVQYIKLLTDLYNIHGDLPLCYSIDEEGNSFSELFIRPEAGNFLEYTFAVTNWETDEPLPITHICIN